MTGDTKGLDYSKGEPMTQHRPDYNISYTAQKMTETIPCLCNKNSELVSIELKRAVKCWRRRYKNQLVTDAERAEARVWGGSGIHKHYERLRRNSKRVQRAANEYKESLVFNFEHDSVALIWQPMHQQHWIYLIERSVTL